MTDISTWEISLGPRVLLGRRDLGRYSPCYELAGGLQVEQDPRGRPTGRAAIVHQCSPVCWLPSVTSVPVQDGASRILVSELSPEDQAELRRAVAHAEAFAAMVKAQQSGIVVAPESALESIRGKAH